ncbi:MAG: YkgJ family cysteine cluster protein [Desulfuromonadales bacterium]
MDIVTEMPSLVCKSYDRFDHFAGLWLAEYRKTGRTIYCREGCAGCCQLAVHATWPEAAAIVGRLSEWQINNLNNYVRLLQKVTAELADLKSYLKRHRQELGPCPFVDAQDCCSIYPMRPLSCRSLLSTRPAAWCTVDFSELTDWDKRAFESSLDRQVVAWPTHYVAATQDLGRVMESSLLAAMRQNSGWAVSGNFAVMVWLASNSRLNSNDRYNKNQLQDLIVASQLDNPLLLNFTDGIQEHGTTGQIRPGG